MGRIFDQAYVTRTCEEIKRVFKQSKEYMEDMLDVVRKAEAAMAEVPSYAKDSSVYGAMAALRSQIQRVDLDGVIARLDEGKEKAAVLIPEADGQYARETESLISCMEQIKGSLTRIMDFLVNTPLTVDYASFMVDLEVAKAKCEEIMEDGGRSLEKILANVKGAETISMVFSKDPVNLSTGNFIYDRTDLEIRGRTPFILRRFYNALNTRRGVFGRDWNHNYETFLEENGKERILLKEDGKEERFMKNAAGTWVSVFHSDGSLGETKEGFFYETRTKQTYHFDREGYCQRKEYPNGYFLKLTYKEGKGRRLLQRVEDSLGSAFTFSYTEAGQLEKVEDHTGRSVFYGYDEQGHLKEVVQPDGTSLQYGYTPEGKLWRVTNPRGIVTVENRFDERMRTIHQTFPDGGSMSYVYDDEAGTVELTERNGSKVTYVHDKQYRDIKHIHENGEERYEYNQRNQKTLVVDRLGNKTQYGYDPEGNLTRIIDALGNQTQIRYGKDAQPVEVRINGQTKVKAAYDEGGNLTAMEDALGNVTAFSYNKKKLPEEIRQADGSVVRLSYDERGNILGITDAAGHTTAYEYDGLNRLTQSTDPKGNCTRYAYDVMGNVIRMENAQGSSRSYEYNESGKVIKITDFDGESICREYNVLNRPSRLIDKEGRQTLLTYDSMWNLARVTTPDGAKTTYIYNQENLLGRIKYPDGATRHYTYDAKGNLIEEEDETGARTRFTYDALGRVIEIKGEEGLHYQYTYDGEGNLIRVKDALEHLVELEYDGNGNLIRETNPLGESRSYGYTCLGKVESITDEIGRTVSYGYYPGGQLKEIRYPDGRNESFTYDANSNLESHTLDTGFTLTYTYDCLNRLVEVGGSEGEKKHYTYDVLGQVTSMTDGKGNTTRYEYTLSGQLAKVTDALGNETEYRYDVCDRLVEIRQYGEEGSLKEGEDLSGMNQDLIEAERINGKNRLCHLTRYTRDLRGRVREVVDALGQKEAYTYDPKGQLLEKLDKEGYLTRYAYTKQGDVSRIRYADGREVKLSYNPLRQLIEVKDWLGLTRLENDALGRATKVTYPDNREVAYTYGRTGERTSITYPDGRRVHYGYDEQLRLSSLQEGERIITYGYDSAGRLAEKHFPNGTKTSYAYNAKGQLRELVHEDREGILDHYTYGYDLTGNKIGITKERRGLIEESGTYSYGYDALDRLVSVTKEGRLQTRYYYDAFGNRTGREREGKQTFYQYNALNQLTSLVDQNADEVSRETYHYDKRGNLSQIVKDGKVKNRYLYGAINRLEEAVNGEGELARYLYNGLGHRVGKEVGHQEQPLDPMARLKEQRLNPTSRIDYTLDLTRQYHNLLEKREKDSIQTYFWDGNVAGLEEQGKRSYYLMDELGSPIRFLGEEGSLEESYGYDEFGQDLYHNQGVIQPFGYTGYQSDRITGTYYAQAREYQAEVGRFVAEDILKGIAINPQTQNRYKYCLNNSFKYIDPTGCCEEIGDDKKEGLSFDDNLFKLGIELERFSDNLYGFTVDGLNITSASTGTWLKKGIVEAIRPSNIGKGTWSRQISAQLDDVARTFGSSVDDVVRGFANSKITGFLPNAIDKLSYAGVAIDVGIGIQENIEKGSSLEKTVSDAMVDTTISAASMLAAGAAGAKIGAWAGSVAPGAGNVVGAVAGFVVGVGTYVVTDVITINGKSVRENIKDGISSLFGWK